ncbi:hypothetical protein J6590_034116 [Homalodisca vitripennis]|nr:hypothetical protein J6590_034116 [Homalodisca vitripennis]
MGEVRAKKPSLTLNLVTNGLKVTSKPPPTVGQAGCLQGQDRSAVTHPSSRHDELLDSVIHDNQDYNGNHRRY